jgi:predicted DNA-binding protein
MRNTLTIRLTKAQADWLRETADRTGVPQGHIVREHLEKAMTSSERRFMSLAGSAKGPRNLSSRRGFERP